MTAARIGVLAWALAGCSQSLPQPVSLSLEGSALGPRVHSLKGTPEEPGPGDVVSVYIPKRSEDGTVEDHDTLMTLGDERACDFRTPAERPGVVMMGSRVVGVHVYRRDDLLVDPLAGLSDGEIRGLWGICLEEWSEPIADRLRHLDPDRTCVKLAGDACRSQALSALPKGLRYLSLDNPRGTPAEGLSSFERLLFLRVSGNVTLCDLAGVRDLVFLDLHFSGSLPTAWIGGLRGLRVLDLRYQEELESLEFGYGLKNLRSINVEETAVGDLSPLARLPELHAVTADGTKVKSLPDGGFPALRRLSVTRTGMAREEADRFKARHRACTLRWNYTQLLADALKGVDRLRVRSGGTCDDGEKDRTLLETPVAAEIRELVSALAVEEPRASWSCGCCGRPTLEFFRGARRVAVVGVHHGVGLRWRSGEWSSDAHLTAAAGDSLCRWLADRGVPDPLEERSKKR